MEEQKSYEARQRDSGIEVGDTALEVVEQADETKIGKGQEMSSEEIEQEYEERERVIVGVVKGIAVAVIILLAVAGTFEVYDTVSDWYPRVTNTSERVDCLEAGEHDWRYVDFDRYRGWKFECRHCFKQVANTDSGWTAQQWQELFNKQEPQAAMQIYDIWKQQQIERDTK